MWACPEPGSLQEILLQEQMIHDQGTFSCWAPPSFSSVPFEPQFPGTFFSRTRERPLFSPRPRSGATKFEAHITSVLIHPWTAKKVLLVRAQTASLALPRS